MILAYCGKCKTETRHRKLKVSGFLMQCVIAGMTKFKADLREPSHECNKCGKRISV